MIIKIGKRYYESEEKAKTIQICSYCDVKEFCKPTNELHKVCHNELGEEDAFKLIEELNITNATLEFEEKDLTK